VQLLQLQHGHELPALRVTGTLDALAATTAAGLLDPGDAEVLRTAWLLAARARNAVTLVTGKISDLLPEGGRPLDGVARLLGYAPECGPELLVDVRAQLDRARAVVERVFYEAGAESGAAGR
jgi:glutamate-ammonia-ligase adenylyltransferase